MRYIGTYSAQATPTYAALANASTEARRAALTALVGRVNTAGAAYAAAMPDVHTLAAAALTKMQKETLIDGYDGRSADVKRLLEAMRKSLAREHRDLCPFCCLESTAQLDHFLPKRGYPEFSLHAPNLIPICPVCNQRKGPRLDNAAGQRHVLMPTMDQAANQRVLVASMRIVPVPRVSYEIDPHAHLAPDELALVQRHFAKLGLALRYRRRAQSLTAAMRANIRKTGSNHAAAHRLIHEGHATALLEEPVNSWRVALYEAIVANAAGFEAWLVS